MLTFPTFQAAATVADSLRRKLNEGAARVFDPAGAPIEWVGVWGSSHEPSTHLYIAPGGTDDQPRRLYVEKWPALSDTSFDPKNNSKPLATWEVARFEDVTPPVRPRGYVPA